MKSVVLEQIHTNIEDAIHALKIVDKPIPQPGAGQVLVKMEAAPCNPSDLLFLQGRYGVRKALPTTPGWEGAGTVVECGSGVLAWFLKGKRVACGGQSKGDGTWAEYYVADAKSCVPLVKDISFDQGATLIINPLTAVGMVDLAEKEGRKAMIQTAACSQVGRMVQTLARVRRIPLINIVRSLEQMNDLASERWVLNSSDADFREKLAALSKQLNATIAFDAVGGEMSGILFDAMPAKSKVVVYGALAGATCRDISPLGLIFQEKQLEGFWLAQFLRDSGFLKIYQSTQLIQSLMKQGEFQTKIRETVSFNGWKSALLHYQQQMTAGKVILRPNSG